MERFRVTMFDGSSLITDAIGLNIMTPVGRVQMRLCPINEYQYDAKGVEKTGNLIVNTEYVVSIRKVMEFKAIQDGKI